VKTDAAIETTRALKPFLARDACRVKATLRVADLIEAAGDLELEVAAGADGLDRTLTSPRVQVLGLALQGIPDDLESGSIQVLGRAERRCITENAIDSWSFLEDETGIGCLVMPEAEADDAREELSNGFLARIERTGLPLLTSTYPRPMVEARLLHLLEERLAPSLCLHGELVVFCGLGLLILGESGIGKSDCALDLIMNGHQLVADDGVLIRRNPLGQLIGKSSELIQNHMDIRGLGIVNIRELFSVYSVIEEHPIDLILMLERWREEKTYACFNERGSLDILGVERPLIRIPVSQGRNWVNLIHVAVRRFILASKGYDAEEALADKLDALLEAKNTGSPRPHASNHEVD